ncbi:MAG: hypothetical protein U0Z26_00265 [Anaerolineales bacterium]
MKNSSTLQWVLRITGIIQLILGGIVWAVEADSLIMPHMLVGTIFTIALFILTYQAYRAGVVRWLVALAAVWALVLPIWGAAQEHIFPENYFWLSQILHVLCGVGAIGLGEMMAVKMRKSK